MASREQNQNFNFGELTVLLRRWSSGDREALDLLVPMIYAELKRIASLHMRREHNPGTLQASALVNEAYVRLAGGPVADFTTRAHFFALASRVMRQILVDRARTRNRVKRGGGATPVQLTEISAAIEAP